MNYGLYLSAAGALTSLHRQDVHANNLANVNTVGFKPDMAVTRDRLPARLEQPFASIDSNLLLEQLGGGQFIDPTRISLKQGQLTQTGNALDVAVNGQGMFVVGSPADMRLTRDGRFTVDSDGMLTMASTGLRVLDVAKQPIQLDPTADVQIAADGEISQNGRVVARMQVVQPSDPALLQKVGDNLMRLSPDAAGNFVPASGTVVQGHVESSAVDPIMTMNAMIGASKSVSSNATMMQYHDHIMDQAINTFGRVA